MSLTEEPSESSLSREPSDASQPVVEIKSSLDVSVIERSTSAPVLVDEATCTSLKTCSKSECPILRRLQAEQTSNKGCSRNDCPIFRRLKLERSSSGSIKVHASDSNGPENEGAVKTEPETDPNGNRRDSPCTSSVAGSGAGSRAGSGQCSAVTRALHYHNKLMATLEILENKEETIRVQADSLRLAESRITALTARASELRQELQEKAQELRALQARESEKGSRTSVGVSTDVEEHRRVVGTLESNLSVIQELYRECFYEAAKQEKLIEMLRSDILDVRLMDKQKDTQIQKLQSVVHTQKWSLERCRDIAMEVDNLKMEISNFLNSSNHDSGMWERDPSPSQGDAMADLREISAQLLTLRDMLTVDCTCGLQEENMRLKRENDKMQVQIAHLQQRLTDVEAELAEKEQMEQQHSAEVEQREKQLSSLSIELISQKRSSKDLSGERDELARQLKQSEVLLGDKCAELATVQHQLEQEQVTSSELKDELLRANDLLKENTKIRGEVNDLRAQVAMWRTQLVDSEASAAALRDQLQRARELCRQVDRSYKEKAQCASSVQCQLEEAQERGAALCDDTRRVLDAVRRWTCSSRHMRSEQEKKIKEQEDIIKSLQRRLDEKSSDRSSLEQSCSCCRPRPCRQPAIDADTVSSIRLASRSRPCGGRRGDGTEGSSSSTPLPPQRKRERSRSSVQRPVQRDAAQDTHSESDAPRPPPPAPGPRDPDVRHVRVFGSPFRRTQDLSPSSELEARMCQLDEALTRSSRRWNRVRSASQTR